MSISHSLKFESQLAERDVLDLLLSSDIGLQPATYDQMKCEGLYARVSTVEKTFGDYLQDKYKTCINLNITFDEDSDGDIDIGEVVMGKAVALVLQRESGDAIFFHVVDTPIMKRVDGRITVVKEEWSKWLTNALTEAGLKYDVQPV